MKTSYMPLSAVLMMVASVQAQEPRISASAIMVNLTNTQFLAKSGGIIQAPAQGPAIRIVNIQNRVSHETVTEIVNGIQKLTRLTIQIERVDAKGDVLTVAETVKKRPSTAVVMVISDCPDRPALLVAPESCWAVVNVETLATSEISPELLVLRLKKEMLRAFGYIMGAANSGYEACVMKPVFKTEDLDAIKGSILGPDTLMKTSSQALKMGIKPVRITTYRKACEEGWASMPTNNFQKAIWEEIKSGKK